MSLSIDLSIVVPVYQSALTLRELVRRLLAVGQELNRTTEIILVDDGSPDSSWEVLCSLKQELGDALVCVQLMRNYGQHNALMCGFRHARGRVIVTIDDDLQNPPEETSKLIRRLDEGEVDVVYGIPGERQDPAWRRIGSNVIQVFVQKAIGLPGPMSAFRAIRRPVVDAILRYDLNYTCVDGLIAWNTSRIQYVTVRAPCQSRRAVGVLCSAFGVLCTEYRDELLTPTAAGRVGCRLPGIFGWFCYRCLLPDASAISSNCRSRLCLHDCRGAGSRWPPTVGPGHHR